MKIAEKKQRNNTDYIGPLDSHPLLGFETEFKQLSKLPGCPPAAVERRTIAIAVLKFVSIQQVAIASIGKW